MPVLLVLAIIILPLVDKNFRSSMKPEMKDFAVKHTESVNKIFMASKSGAKVLLEKNKDGKWTVNGKYEASAPKINLLLNETLPYLKVKNPIPKEGVESVKKLMAAGATKVEIYHDDELTKVFYVGGNTADELGTYMYLEGSSVPFVVSIPGFHGYVSSRFPINERHWRNTNIFNTDILQLAEVKVTYPADKQQSFVITKRDKKLEIVSQSPSYGTSMKVNEAFLKQYTAIFTSLTFEGFFEGLANSLADSVVRSAPSPFARIEVKDLKGKSTSLDIYLKPVSTESKAQVDEKGQPIPYDLDRYYAVINGEKSEIVSVQSYVFKNVLQPLDAFFIQ